MSVQEVHLGDVARVGDTGRGIGEAVGGGLDRVPRGEVTPVLGDVDIAVRALGLVGNEGEGGGRAGVVGISGRGLDGGWLDTRSGDTGVADLGLAREERRVGSGWMSAMNAGFDGTAVGD